jgi:ATP-binding cassette subfamily B protein
MKNVLKFLLLQYFRYRWQSVTMSLLMILSLAYQVTFSYSFKYLVDDILVPGKFERLTLFLSLLVAGAILSSILDLASDGRCHINS